MTTYFFKSFSPLKGTHTISGRGRSDTLDEVLHLHFQVGVRVQEGLLQAEIQKEEEGALQVEVRKGLPTQVRVRHSSPERSV